MAASPTSSHPTESPLKNKLVVIPLLSLIIIALLVAIKLANFGELGGGSADPDLNLNPAGYVPQPCVDDDHMKVINVVDYVPEKYRDDLPIGTQIPIGLHEGCFADTFVFPKDKIYDIVMSNAPGDWEAIHCLGDPNYPRHVERAKLGIADIPECYPHGRKSIFAPAVDTSPRLSLEGVGTITFVVKAEKIVFY